MGAYATYNWEWETWPEPHWRTPLTDKEILRYTKKLVRHFKTPHLLIRRAKYHGRGGGAYSWAGFGFYFYYPGRNSKKSRFVYMRTDPKRVRYNRMIKLSAVVPFGVLLHEFAHHLCCPQDIENRRKGKPHYHGKHFRKALKRVYKWAERWLPELEAARRTQ